MNSELWLFLHFTSWTLILSFICYLFFFFFCSFSFKYLNVTHQFWILTLNTYRGKEAGGSVGGGGGGILHCCCCLGWGDTFIKKMRGFDVDLNETQVDPLEWMLVTLYL